MSNKSTKAKVSKVSKVSKVFNVSNESKISDCDIYNSIPNTSNLLSTLIDTIMNDDLFQKHVNLLNTSSDPVNTKKAHILNNTINNIRVFNTKLSPLFLAKDIGILLGISHIKYLINKFDVGEVVTGYITTANNKTEKVLFLTRHGIYRCFYASKSPLAKLFRKFISNLIDHMITYENDLLKKISDAFKVDHPEMIEQGIIDLNNKLIEYESKYIEEKNKASLLELKCDEEHQKNNKLEFEKTEVDIINSYNMMHIEQLKQEKINCSNTIKNINDALLDITSPDLLELKMIKEKYMKPLYIYILHPVYFNKLLVSNKKDLVQNLTNNPDLNNKPELKKIDDIISDMPIYSKNFEHIFSIPEDTYKKQIKTDDDEKNINIEREEIIYFYINFSRNVVKNGKLILVDTQWIADKKHFTNVINILSDTCDVINLNKYILYKTSIDEIHDIIREEFIRK